MFTREMLTRANTDLQTVNVKGKNYVMVKDRIKGFREACPGGSIVTNIEHVDDSSVIISCTVADADGTILAKDYAQETRGGGGVNRTSFVENCSTSAIGRALGACGIGIDDSMGSADEVANAIMQQNAAARKPEDHEIKFVKNWLIETNSDTEAFLQNVSRRSGKECHSVDEMDYGQYIQAMKLIEKKNKKMKEDKENE